MHTRTHAATYLAACSVVVIDSLPTHTYRFTHTDPHTEVDTDIQEGRVWQGFAFCEENGVETEMKQQSMEMMVHVMKQQGTHTI